MELGGWNHGFSDSCEVVLVMYCRSFTNEIVKEFSQDHLFDVIINVIGLIVVIPESTLYWWIDPVGAIVLDLSTQLFF